MGLAEIRSDLQGVDFFFSNRAHATKFVDFLSNVVPIRYRNDKQLVSHNTHTSTYNYKYTYSVEIAPICRVSLHASFLSCMHFASLPHKISFCVSAVLTIEILSLPR